MHSLHGSKSTALEVVCCEWRNALLVVQTRNDDDGVDCIGSRHTIGKLSRVLSRIREIFIETLNKNVTEFLNVRKFREILHLSEF